MNILTFDIEDWYCHDDYSRDFNWDKHEVRIYEGVDKILIELERHNRKATFFCLGWIAEKHPAVIRKISEAKHHIGCHSYQHDLATRFAKKEFKDDTEKAKKLIEDVIGKEVNAYRVPSFSVTKSNLFVFEVIKELGFKYDCSVFPAHHEFGGMPEFPAVPFRIEICGEYIKEFPINLANVLGRNIVFAGGGYFRVIPYFLIKRLTRKSPYMMSYFHPSDFDPKQPHMYQLPLMRQFKNRIGLKGAFVKFQHLLNDFEFVNLEEADKMINWNESIVVPLLN